MYRTALQQCIRLGVTCTLSWASPYSEGEIIKFAKEWKPDGVWFILGYSFMAKSPLSKFSRTKAAVTYLKRNGVHVALLPQAVGPFLDVQRKQAGELFSLFDFIAVRDYESQKAIQKVSPTQRVQIVQDSVFSKTLNPRSGNTFCTANQSRSSLPLIGVGL